MKAPVVVVGIGEIGGVFARGLLRCAHPVYPVTRDTTPAAVARQLQALNTEPEMVLVTVTEKELPEVLRQLPADWRDRLGLVQNELLPADWEQYGCQTPTVMSVWFEKKNGREARVIIPSPVFGPHAVLLSEALSAMGISNRLLQNTEQLLYELVLKNLYILTTNLCGLQTGGTVGELWNRHEDFARRVADEVLELQEALTGRRFDREQMIQGMLSAFDGDPQHQCMGRSAAARLERALAQAAAAGLKLPTLERIHTARPGGSAPETNSQQADV